MRTKKRSNLVNKPSFLLIEAIAALFVASVFTVIALGFFGNIAKSSELAKAQTQYQTQTYFEQSFYKKEFK